MSLISYMEEKMKISIIGSLENPISGDNTSMALRINVKCLETHLNEISDVKEIYIYMRGIIRNHGPITFYHKFHKEKNRSYFDIYGCEYLETGYFKTDINNLKQQLDKSLDLDYLYNGVFKYNKGSGWFGVH